MNEQMKKIFDQMGVKEIGLDEEFKFHCNKCGKCCLHREDILLNPQDVYNMSKELKITPQELTDQYCEMYIGRDSRIPIVRLKPRGQIKRCPMLKNKKCMVHNVKPSVCATYPLGRCLTAESVDAGKGKIQYIINHTNCGDNTETHTVREWLNMFGIPVEDEFFIKWQETAIYLARTVPEIEKHTDREEMIMIWLYIFSGMYLNYDTGKNFMPQFEENVHNVRSVIDGMKNEKGGSENV